MADNPMTDPARPPECGCGSEQQGSARFGHPHLKWCPRAAAEAEALARNTLAALLKNLHGLRVYTQVWIAACRQADVVDMRDLAEAIGRALVAKPGGGGDV